MCVTSITISLAPNLVSLRVLFRIPPSDFLSSESSVLLNLPLRYLLCLFSYFHSCSTHPRVVSWLKPVWPLWWFLSGSSDQSLSRVRLFATSWIAARQASLPITNSQSSPRLTSIESVMPSSHLILRRPLFLLPPIPPSIRVFSNESTLHMRWPKYWTFSFSIIPSKEYPGLISLEWIGWISLQSKGLSRVFSNTTVQRHQFFSTQLSSQSNSYIHTWPEEKP